jgi:hypothetical protein
LRARRFFISLAILLLSGLCACSKPLTVEQQIIATIRAMEMKIEEGQRLSFMAHIAEDFSGQDGAMNREQVRVMVIFQLNRHQRLHAQLFPIHVSAVGDDGAKANFRALVTGGPSWIPESGQVFDFVTHWRFVDGDWILQSANWTPVALNDALQEVL